MEDRLMLLIMGKARSGKDTFANLIKEEVELGHTSLKTDVAILAYADWLKDVCKRNHNYENKQEDRDILITTGDDMREIDQNVFSKPVVDMANIYFEMGYKLVIVSDLRYEDEYKYTKENVNAKTEIIKIKSEHEFKGVSEYAKQHPTENPTFLPTYTMEMPTIIKENEYEIRSQIQKFINWLPVN